MKEDFLDIHNFKVVDRGRTHSINNSHEVVFAIQQRNIEQLKILHKEISNPTSKMYRKYLSRKEVAEISANRRSSCHVTSYLKSIPGIKILKTNKYGEFIKAEGIFLKPFIFL